MAVKILHNSFAKSQCSQKPGKRVVATYFRQTGCGIVPGRTPVRSSAWELHHGASRGRVLHRRSRLRGAGGRLQAETGWQVRDSAGSPRPRRRQGLHARHAGRHPDQHGRHLAGRRPRAHPRARQGTGGGDLPAARARRQRADPGRQGPALHRHHSAREPADGRGSERVPFWNRLLLFRLAGWTVPQP